MRNFISIQELSRQEILDLLALAKELKEQPEPDLLKGKIVATLFFEPSTRTRLSFTSAAYRIGANVLGFDSIQGTSVMKGESFEDTIRMVSSYSDVIVIRHPQDGTAQRAANISSVPVINAGDGKNEHPSQTLLDLYTIQEELGSLEDKKIAFIGDLKYGRTVHSLTRAMKHFHAKFYFVAPDLIQMPRYLLQELEEAGLEYSLHRHYEEILAEIDILYMTRIQKERFEDPKDFEKVESAYRIEKEDIVGKCQEHMIILHPLPRVDEIAVSVDECKHALYFQQAANGVPVREAMMALAVGKK
ncbi:MAG TPA: aspartate carbamoyltransferase [Fusobacterium sp.]|uniref:aspartate carbamoyltransferase n=1 Tax=Fusobacterium sp. TaxID=68766 RepID=UPI002F40203F